MELLDSEQSEAFVEALQEAGFDLSDWDYLESLAREEGLSPDQAKSLDDYRRIVATVSEKYGLSD